MLQWTMAVLQCPILVFWNGPVRLTQKVIKENSAKKVLTFTVHVQFIKMNCESCYPKQKAIQKCH